MLTHNKYLFFVTFLLLFSSPFAYSQCLEKSLFGDQRHIANCPQIVEDTSLGKAKGLNLESPDGGMIQIKFNCDQKPDICSKAKIAFNNAATIVENTFDLKAPLIINASFVQLCGTFLTCEPGQSIPLGAAGPSRFIPLSDDDGSERLFPQALVKQFQLAKHPEFNDVDIIAGFNSESSTFWFRGDPEIGKDQVDFEIVLVHEFLHGLGFITSWDDNIPNNPSMLTPSPSFADDANNVTFNGFREYSLDKHLVLTKDNSSLTLITNELNQFVKVKSEFADKQEFASDFAKSPQSIVAETMFKTATTNDSVAFTLPDTGENVLMETSLVPYRSGSSFTHVDFNTYSNTTDFLMRFKAPRQVILDDLTSINGNDPTYTNPIGPRTIDMLKSIGYSVKPNPGSFKISSSQPPNPDQLSQTNTPTESTESNQPKQSGTPSASGPANTALTNTVFTFTINTLLILSFIITILLL